MLIFLIANTKSGGSTDSTDVAGRLRDAGATLVDDAADADRVVACGGDGTLGPAAELAGQHGIPLGVIASGTANDFARSQGLPREMMEATTLAATGSQTRHCELGRMDGRPFVNAVSGGLSPAAAERAAPLKGALGPLAYTAGGLAAGILDDPLECTVEGHFEGSAWQIIVACTGAFGGGAEIEATRPDDGELDLLVVPAGGRLELPKVALAMRKGSLAELEDVIHVRSAAFTVRVPEGTQLNLDGELCGVGGRVELAIDPRGFEVVCG